MSVCEVVSDVTGERSERWRRLQRSESQSNWVKKSFVIKFDKADASFFFLFWQYVKVRAVLMTSWSHVA